jgi:glycosyltransferase involved in cell wall biosynthesis
MVNILLMSADEPQATLSVVIPSLNAADTIAAQLDALEHQEWTKAWEVLVVDGGSTDGTVDVVELYRGRLPGLRFIEATEKPGQAHALNVGVREARSPAVVFCDADDEVAPGWLAAMAAALEEHDLAGCAADGEKLNEPWARDVRDVPAGLSKLWFPPYTPFAGSGGLGVQRSAHEVAGGFDESMPVLFDVEFCVRAQSAGFKLAFVPDALIHYRFRHAWRQIFGQARTYAIYGASLQKRVKAADARFPGVARWALTGWRPVLRSLARIHRRDARARLAWQLGWLLGRFQGSVRFRVLAV